MVVERQATPRREETTSQGKGRPIPVGERVGARLPGGDSRTQIIYQETTRFGESRSAWTAAVMGDPELPSCYPALAGVLKREIGYTGRRLPSRHLAEIQPHRGRHGPLRDSERTFHGRTQR